MHWTLPDVLALPTHLYVELVEWLNETPQEPDL